MPFRIEALSDQNLSDINRANQPFEILGKVIPSLQNGRWSLKESLLPEEERYLKTYPCDEVDYTAYIGSGDRAAFLCYNGTECIGQTVLRRDWNRYAFVEDLCVAAQHRRKGAGKALMERAFAWAKSQGCRVMLIGSASNPVRGELTRALEPDAFFDYRRSSSEEIRGNVAAYAAAPSGSCSPA